MSKRKKKPVETKQQSGRPIFSRPMGLPGAQEGAALLTEGRFGAADQKFQLSIVAQFTTADGSEMLASQAIAAILDAVSAGGGDRLAVLAAAIKKEDERGSENKTG